MSSIIKVDTVQDQDGNNIINENANTITIGASGDTITIPSGATLANNGTATGFASIAWQSVVTAATLTTVAGKGYPINTTSNACTVTLPSSASVGDQVQIVDYAGTFATNNIILTSSLNIEGGTNDKALTTNREGVTITYVDVTQGWVATSGVNSGTQAIDPVYSVDFLVIAGGGGGGTGGSGQYNSGGGGAGGYRNSFSTESSGGGGSSEASLTFTQGTVYTITVGAGGATDLSGSNSIISGTLTTVTSTGGGRGGTNIAASTGGSGGGGASTGGTGSGTGASGTANQGFAGGNGAGASGFIAGGGGGAEEAGNTDGQGEGGDGLASSISGSSITRGGGGGGSGTTTPGSGGTGGGGAGSITTGVAGTVNTGGGGGGGAADTSAAGGAGGSGVVILSMPLASFSGTVTGSPTESDDGTTKRLIFNASGSYTG